MDVVEVATAKHSGAMPPKPRWTQNEESYPQDAGLAMKTECLWKNAGGSTHRVEGSKFSSRLRKQGFATKTVL